MVTRLTYGLLIKGVKVFIFVVVLIWVYAVSVVALCNSTLQFLNQ